MSDFRKLFSRSLQAAPGRLHFAAHSHHLWPDASFDGHTQAWEDAARFADHKWDKIAATVVPEAQMHLERELGVPRQSVVFAPNTHEFVMRLMSCLKPNARVLCTDGEFHSFRRQSQRLAEEGAIALTVIPVAPFATFAERFTEALSQQAFDLVFVSHVFFNSGYVFDGALDLHRHAHTDTGLIVVDGYHGFMAVPSDAGQAAHRQFYLSGGYKYAMAGEGVCFLSCPPGDERPLYTGWYAEFETLSDAVGDQVAYPKSAGRFAGSTYDPSGLYRFNHIQRMLTTEGLTTATISQHVQPLMQRFAEAVASRRAGALCEAELINPITDTDRQARFLAYRHPQAAQWKADLESGGVITDVRGDVLRFGFGLYHTADEVDELIYRCQEVIEPGS